MPLLLTHNAAGASPEPIQIQINTLQDFLNALDNLEPLWQGGEQNSQVEVTGECDFELRFNARTHITFPLIFQGVTFQQACFFENLTFHSLIEFREVRFEQQVHVYNVQFNQSCSYINTSFRASAHFQNITLPTSSSPALIFEDCYSLPDTVHLHAFNMQAMSQVSITGGNGITGFVFDGCRFPPFNTPTWSRFLDLLQELFIFLDRLCVSYSSHAALPQAMHNQYVADPMAGMIAYSNLKAQAESRGEKTLANDFYFWEMWFKLHTFRWYQPEALVLRAYLWISHFGLSIVLPVFWLIVISEIFAHFYHHFFNTKNHVIPFLSSIDWLKQWLTSFGLTLPTDFFVKSSIDRTWHNMAHFQPVISGVFVPIQLIIQGFLLLEFALALRNKVKR